MTFKVVVVIKQASKLQ